MAMVLVGAVAGAIGFGGAAAIAAGALIGFGVQTLISDAFDFEPPSVDYSRLPTSNSPTYSNKIRQNQARVGEAMPIIIGDVKFYPDVLNTPHHRYKYRTEVTYYILSLGNGDLDANVEFYIGNTPISNFKGQRSILLRPGISSGASYESIRADANGMLIDSIYHRAVMIDGVAGAELAKDGDNDGIYGEYLFSPATKAGFADLVINFIAKRGVYTLSGGNPVSASIGFHIKVVVKHPDQTETVSYDQPFSIASDTDGPTDPTYASFESTVSVAVGDVVGVTVTRLDDNYTSGGVSDCHFGQIYIDSLKIQEDDVWRALFRIEANAELAKSAETKIMAKASNPNAATVRQSVEYVWQKAGLDMANLDAAILDTATVTAVNGVLDVQQGVHDTIKKITAIARAYPVRSAEGKTTFYVDANRSVSYVFDNDNTVEDSVKVKLRFLQENDNDGMKVRWFNSDSMVEQFATYPVGAVNPKQIDLFGCTDGVVALAHATYLYKKQQYQNKTITWQTELDGNVVNVGEVVSVVDAYRGISETVVITGISPERERVSLTGINYDERVYQ